jgi:hypothetical protein
LTFAEVMWAAVDAELTQLFLGAVLRQAPVQSPEINAIRFLVLLDAGEHDRLSA